MPKLQQTASGSYFLTVPLSWVMSYGWKKGIDIMVKPVEGGFIVTKAKVQKQKQVRKERKVVSKGV